jgi:hypothetical protein
MTETLNDAATNPQQTIAEFQRKLAERTAERDEALERQTATADILKVIASSPSDVQPVFEAIAASANRLIGGLSTAVYSLIDDMQHLSAFTPINPAADAALQALYPRPLSMQPGPNRPAMARSFTSPTSKPTRPCRKNGSTCGECAAFAASSASRCGATG